MPNYSTVPNSFSSEGGGVLFAVCSRVLFVGGQGLLTSGCIPTSDLRLYVIGGYLNFGRLL